MNLLLWIFFGGFVGWVASILTKSNKRMGLLANIIVGILGSFIGGWLASLFGIGTFSNFSLPGVLIAIGGACLLIVIINSFRSKR